MPEPTSTASAVSTLVAAGLSSTAVTAFGIPLGLHADVLCAGFSGSLAAIILLNSVTGATDTWHELVKTTARRMAVVGASSLTAGYITPLVMLSFSIPVAHELMLGAAFAVGGGAQQVLAGVMRKLSGSDSDSKGAN